MAHKTPFVLTLWFLIGAWFSPAVAQEEPDAPDFEGFDELVDAAMKHWSVPGLAVAAVKDGAVVLSRGYGHRDVENELPVTPRTLFAIGSITKSFTVVTMGMLVDEGKLDWDEPVRTYLPDFRLHDETATLQMTPRDLVTHRSGLPRHDLLWYGSPLTRRELYERLRYLQPSKGFRSEYQYNNLMFMTAGYLAGSLAGTSWEDLVRGRVLEPLGMRRSNLSVTESQKDDDFAWPYGKEGDMVTRIPFRNIDAVGPAGSINSSVEEMLHYLQFHIDEGSYEGKRLLSEGNARAMRAPVIGTSGSTGDKEFGDASYGLGLVTTSYRGRALVQHGGGIDGFIALASFLPREKIGVVVLTNLSPNGATSVVTTNVIDRLLGLDQVDFLGRARAREDERRRNEAAAEAARTKGGREGTTPSHPLEEYVGEYEHPAYGSLRIEKDGDALRARYRDWTVALEHYHYDVFRARSGPPMDGAKILFLYDKEGSIDRVTVPLEPRVDDVVFERRPDESMRSPEFLEQFVGEYSLAGITAVVALDGDRLTLKVPGQPTHALVPRRDMTFDVEGLEGFSVEFRKDGAGRVVEAVGHQPNGSFVARKKLPKPRSMSF